MSSFWDSLQNVGANIIQSTQNSLTNLTAYPDSATCTSCMVVTAVPASTFAWNCRNGHPNTPLDATCTQCPSTKKESKGLGIYQPKITCSNTACAKPILLSETAIANSLWSTMVTTPYHVEKAVGSAVESAKDLAKPPTIFSCRYCNSQLYTPTGPWTCFFDNCNTNNPAGTYSCSQCSVGRYSAGVTCSICHRSTAVPQIKFVAEVESAFNNVQTMATNTYKYVDGSTVAPCHTCHFPIQLEKEQVRLILGLAPTAPVPGFDKIILNNAANDVNNIPQAQNRTADEEEIFAKLNEEEKPLSSDAPAGADSKDPTPQDVLCQKCLHMNTISKEQLVSRQIPKQTQQTISQPTPEELQQQHQKQQRTQATLRINHVDENGQAIQCGHCHAPSNIISPVTPCTTCRLPYCRKCAPYTRNSTLYCFGCATQYDNDAVQRQQQQMQQQQQQQQVPIEQQQQQPLTSPQGAAIENPPIPADPYENLQ